MQISGARGEETEMFDRSNGAGGELVSQIAAATTAAESARIDLPVV